MLAGRGEQMQENLSCNERVTRRSVAIMGLHIEQLAEGIELETTNFRSSGKGAVPLEV